MAQINHFNGGLSTRISPQLININEGQVYTNIDNSSVSLKPIKGNTDEAQTVLKYMFNFNDGWVSSSNYRTYLEFQEKLYYSDSVGIPQKSSDGITFNNLGISKPTVTPITSGLSVEPTEVPNDTPIVTWTSSVGGTLGPGTYDVFYTFEVGGVESDISNIGSVVVTAPGSFSYIVVASEPSLITKNVYISKDGGTYYLQYTGTSSSKNITAFSTTTAYVPYVAPPGITGTYQYCYTYYNSVDGSESMPSTYSDEMVLNQQTLSVSVTASTDPQVDGIKLYRIGGGLTSMQLVDTLANTTAVYADVLGDLDIPGLVLDSFTAGQAPTGLKYLTENNSMLFGTVDDKLWYCDVAYPNDWSPYSFIDFDREITGLGAVSNGLLVFTKFKTYIITGTSPDTLSKYLLSGNQGCLDHRSVQFANNNLIWLSSDGICVSNGSEIQVSSRDKLGKYSVTSVNDSAIYDDAYYLAHADGILVADFRFGLIFKKSDTIADGLFVYNDILYFSRLDALYSMETSSTYKSLTYKTPRLHEAQISNLKTYKSIYVRCFGTLSITVSIDGVSVITKTIDEDTSEIKVPQATRKGYYIEFDITGTGELLELQYIVEGRQNGK